MSRSLSFFRWVGQAVLLAALSWLCPPATAQHTNIVVIVADDLGWADIGYNNPAVYTPNLDALAAGGVRFAQHYVMSQCTPTRAALFTGRYPSRSGTQAQQASNDQSYPHGTLTLSSMLAEMGYTCYMAGKWHMGSAPEWGPNHHGFDESYGSLAGAVGMYDHRYRPNDPYEITWHRNHDIIPGYENGIHATDLVADDAIRFIGRTHDGPFFVYLPFHAPHTPLDERGSFTNTPTQLDPTDNTHWLNEDAIPWFTDPSGKIQSEPDPEKRLLLAVVHHLDDAVGRIVAALDNTEQRDNTIIFFSSDNGPQVNWSGNAYPDDLNLTNFNQPDTLRGSKTDVYEGGTLVPGFVNWPARIAPRVVTNPVHIVDWIPTIAGMVGYTPASDPGWDGEDIMPLIDGTGSPGERSFYWLWGSGSSRWAVRHGDWKVVHYGSEPASASDWALFNLADDPREATNLASTATAKRDELHDVFVSERDKDLKGEIVSPRLIGPRTAAGPFGAQVTFTESVSGLELNDFVFVNATGSGFSGSGASYAFSVTPTLASTGVVSVTLPAGAASASGGRTNAPSNALRVGVETAQADPDITTGLISHYPFDRSARNHVPGAPDGTFVNGAAVTNAGHRVGMGCLVLDGTNDYVSVTTDGYPNHTNGLETGTLAVWLKTTTTAWSAPAGTLNQADSTAFLLHINFNGTEDASRLLVRDSNDGTGTQQFDGTLDVNDGDWHHIAVSWGPKDADARMVRDGIPVATSFPFAPSKKNTSGAVFTPWAFPMTIGARNNRGSMMHHLRGSIDDVRVYDRVLTDIDLAALAAMRPEKPGTTIEVR